MSFFCNIKKISEYLDLPPGDAIPFEPTWHKVAQSFPHWPVVIHDNGYQLKLFEWGVIADYMNTPEKIAEYRTSMANARSEKIIGDKRSAWHRIRHQRCLVFTTGFFEHRDTGGKKKLPYFIKVRDEELFCLAGLYNYSPLPDPETGELTGTFAVITRAANPLLSKIHNAGPNSHRMPLLLDKERTIAWLDPSLTDEAMDKILHFEYPERSLEAWPVNTIRTRKPDSPAVVAPLDASLFPPL